MHLGAHMSIAGGVENAVLRGHSVGCQAIAMFTKNNNQWKAKPLTKEDADRFSAALIETGIRPVVVHVVPDQPRVAERRAVEEIHRVNGRRVETRGIAGYSVPRSASRLAHRQGCGFRRQARRRGIQPHPRKTAEPQRDDAARTHRGAGLESGTHV